LRYKKRKENQEN